MSQEKAKFITEAEQEHSPIERESRAVAEGKLDMLTGKDFRDYALRFVNKDEYFEILQSGILPRANVYSPKIKHGNEAPTFHDYLEKCENSTWDEIISEETDWPSGSMSVNMYNHLIKVLKKARKEVAKGGIQEKYREEVVKRMREMLEAELEDESLNRHIAHEQAKTQEFFDVKDYFDYRYEIFFIALSLERIAEDQKKRMARLRELVPTGVFDRLTSSIYGIEDTIRAVTNVSLPPYIEKEISNLTVDEKTRQEIEDLVSEEYSTEVQLKTLGGEKTIALVRRWLDDPMSVDLRSLVNAVAYNQADYLEPQQYHILLVIDFDAVSMESTSKAYGGWGEVKKGISSEKILGAVTVMPNRELLNDVLVRVGRAGRAAHPIFDNRTAVRYPET